MADRLLASIGLAALALGASGCGGSSAGQTTSTIVAVERTTPTVAGPALWKGHIHQDLKFGPGCSVVADAALVLRVAQDGTVSGTARGHGTYKRAGCGGGSLPVVPEGPVRGRLAGKQFRFVVPFNAPHAYNEVIAKLTGPTSAHARTTDLDGIRTYTITLTCVTC